LSILLLLKNLEISLTSFGDLAGMKGGSLSILAKNGSLFSLLAL